MGRIDWLTRAVNDIGRGGVRFWIDGLRARRTSGELEVHCRGLRPGFTIRGRDSDYMALQQTFIDRQYDVGVPRIRKRIRQRYRAILAEGRVPVIIDAGANVGAATAWFCAAFPEATVIAIEPEPGNAGMLRRNCEAYANAVPVEAAIGSSVGHVALLTEVSSWATRANRAVSGCVLITVADALALVPNPALLIVKIDIEGFEADLFAAATEWLDEVVAVFVEPHDWMLPGERSSGSFQRAFGERDFDLLICGENLAYVRRDGADDSSAA